MAIEFKFDWDRFNIEHIASHSVVPEEVEQVFSNDEMGLDYDVVRGEDRWTAIGETDQQRLLIVVYTMRADSIRTVTAYQASERLRVEYLKVKG